MPERRVALAWPVLLLTALAALPGVAVALTDGGPSVFLDETLYRDNAAAIAALNTYPQPHYPPSYPALLALGQLTPNPFRAMLLLNVAAGVAIVPATWFLAKSLQLRQPWIPTLLAALLPFHAAFTGYLLSENLALPLFVLSVGLAVRGRRSEAIAFGLALGALHLTRYFFLPIILVLAVVWVLRLARTTAGSSAGQRLVRPTALAIGSYLTPLALWTVYGLQSGHRFSKLWGLRTVEAGIARSTSVGWLTPVLTWLSQYSAYLILATPPAWALIALGILQARPTPATLRRWSATSAFAVVTVATTVGYVVLATAHSRGVAYNYPSPSHMQGRYMMQVVPLIVVAGCVALERLSSGRRRPGAGVTILAGTIAAALAWASWWVLFRGGLWSVPAWGAQLPFNGTDVFVLDNWGLAAVVSAAAVGIPLVARISARQGAIAWALIATLVCTSGAVRAVSPPVNGSLGTELARVVAHRTSTGESVTVWLSDRLDSTLSLEQSLDFWGVDLDLVAVERWDGGLELSSDFGACTLRDDTQTTELWATKYESSSVRPVYSGSSRSGGFYVYEVSEACMRSSMLD